MKKTTTTVRRIMRSCLAGIVSLLGFTSCLQDDDNEPAVMYGTPGGTFEVKGSVTDPADRPAEADVILRILTKDGYAYTYPGDTVRTDAEGRYEISRSTAPYNRFRVVCHPKDASLEADSLEVEARYENGSGAWNMGTAKVIADFRLKDKQEEPGE